MPLTQLHLPSICSGQDGYVTFLKVDISKLKHFFFMYSKRHFLSFFICFLQSVELDTVHKFAFLTPLLHSFLLLEMAHFCKLALLGLLYRFKALRLTGFYSFYCPMCLLSQQKIKHLKRCCSLFCKVVSKSHVCHVFGSLLKNTLILFQSVMFSLNCSLVLILPHEIKKRLH